MYEVNFINYLLLAIFVIGTLYVTLIVAKEVCDDLQRNIKPVKRLLRIYLSRHLHYAFSLFRSLSIHTM